MKYLSCMFIYLVLNCHLFGQVIDSFSDGDFSTNPVWTGETDSWQIVTRASSGPNASNSYTLRLNAPDDNSTSQYIATQKSGSWGSEQTWGFWLGRRSSSPATSGNHSVVWLWANESNLESATVDGYRIRFGDSSGDDEILLQRVDNGNATTILASSGPVTNGLDDIGFLIRVTRNSGSVWTLFTSQLPTASGELFGATTIPNADNTSLNQGNVTDNTYTSFNNGYFGFMAIHTTSLTARQGAEFDQLYFDPNSDSSLPVELSFWRVSNKNSAVILDWATESEINNLGFMIYRRLVAGDRYPSISQSDWMEIAGYKTDPELKGQGSVTHRTRYSFSDTDVRPNLTYQYQLCDVDYSGNVTNHGTKTIVVKNKSIVWGIAYPNPFNPDLRLPLQLDEPSPVAVNVYDLRGGHVASLINQMLSEGRHTINWDGTDNRGLPVPAGVYFIRLRSKFDTKTQKVVLTR